MTIFGVILGIFELIALAIFVIFLCFGAVFDRRGHEGFKWWVVFFGIIAFAAFNLSSISFENIWAAISSPTLWSNIGIYVLIGAGYSLLEFSLHVRKIARDVSAKWTHFIRRNDKMALAEGEDVPAELQAYVKGSYIHATMGEMFKHGTAAIRAGVIRSFSTNFSGSSLIRIEATAQGEASPVVVRDQLASYLGAWIVLWPFYAISLVLGDLLEEIWRVLADALAKISGRFVKAAFADIFKI